MRRVNVKWKVLQLQAARPTDMYIGRPGSPNLQKHSARAELNEGIVKA